MRLRGMAHSRWPGVAFRVMLGLAFVPAALAAEDSDTTAAGPPPRSLAEIVVTASRSTPPATVIEIDRAHMLARGATTVAEALEMLPGVTVSVGRKNEVAVRLRGMDPERVLVLVDGRVASTPYYGKVDLHTIPLDRVERIKVALGAASLLYGVNGPAGVVHILTRRGSDDGEADFSVDGAVSPWALPALRDDGTWRVGGASDGCAGMVDWAASVSYDRSNGYWLPGSYEQPQNSEEDGGLRDNSDFARLSSGATIGLRPAAWLDASVSCGLHTEEKGIPSDIQSPAYARFDDWRRGFVDGMLAVDVGESVGMRAKGFYESVRNEYNTYTDGSYSWVRNRSLHENWDAGAELFGDIVLARMTLRTSCRYRQDVANIRAADTAPWQTYENHTLSVAVEDEVDIRPLPLYVTAAAAASLVCREDHGEQTTRSWSVDGALGARAALGWSTVHAGGGRYTRYPSMHELFSTSAGNARLEPEESWKIDAGWSGTPAPWCTVTLSGYAESYRNMISRHLVADASGDLLELYYNVDEARSFGLTPGVSLVSTRLKLRGRLDYAWAWSAVDNGFGEQPLPYAPAHTLIAEAQKGFLDGGMVRLETRGVVGRVDEDGRVLLPYAVVNAALSYQWRHLRLGLTVRNLFDTDYSTEDSGYPMPGRSVRLSAATGGTVPLRPRKTR